VHVTCGPAYPSEGLEYEEAEEMLREALALRERVLGKEHPDTLTSVYYQ
jgi:hypothetical protein